MSTYRDLTWPGTADADAAARAAGALRVGWLGWREPYVRGAVSDEAVGRLVEFTRATTVRTRGYHPCGLCRRESPIYVNVVSGNYETASVAGGGGVALGDAEVWIESRDGLTFVAPSLVIHYILDHGYCPPRLFLDALSEAVLGDSRVVADRALARGNSVIGDDGNWKPRLAGAIASAMLDTLAAADLRLRFAVAAGGVSVERCVVSDTGVSLRCDVLVDRPTNTSAGRILLEATLHDERSTVTADVEGTPDGLDALHLSDTTSLARHQGHHEFATQLAAMASDLVGQHIATFASRLEPADVPARRSV